MKKTVDSLQKCEKEIINISTKLNEQYESIWRNLGKVQQRLVRIGENRFDTEEITIQIPLHVSKSSIARIFADNIFEEENKIHVRDYDAHYAKILEIIENMTEKNLKVLALHLSNSYCLNFMEREFVYMIHKLFLEDNKYKTIKNYSINTRS